MQTIFRKNTKALLALLCMSFSFSLGAADEEALHGCVEPDHFLSYPLENVSGFPAPQTGIDLLDQFLDVATGTAPFLFSITSTASFRLLNPATKFHNGKKFKPERPNTHYVAMPVDLTNTGVTLANRDYRIFNQFDDFFFSTSSTASTANDTIDIDDFDSILVPSAKRACPRGNCILEDIKHCDGDDCFPDGDHYLCYNITRPVPPISECPNPSARSVIAQDQFQRTAPFDLPLATRICNPVDKTHLGNFYDADQQATNHLVCYGGISRSLPASRLVQLLNQFPGQQGVVSGANEFCIPSVKLDLGPSTGNN